MPNPSTQPTQSEPEFACNMDVFGAQELARLLDLIHELISTADDSEDLADGHRLRFDTGRSRYTEFAEWMGLQQRCCPWIKFGLDLDGDVVRISLTAVEAARPALAEEFAGLLAKMRE